MIGLPTLQRIPGFESTAYALLNGQVVWAGEQAVTDHPRHWVKPWQPPARVLDARRLRRGAELAMHQLATVIAAAREGVSTPEPEPEPSPAARGLLLWLLGQALPFPLHLAQARFDAVRTALRAQDLPAFETAALRVLGLGQGLTPSGDDFIGAIFFTLHFAPLAPWQARVPALRHRINEAARTATNPISAALLADLMAGRSYRALHELLDALQTLDAAALECAMHALLAIGASSGADMLAGVLLTLTLTPELDESP